jgi:hypothetical protein
VYSQENKKACFRYAVKKNQTVKWFKSQSENISQNPLIYETGNPVSTP